MKFYGKDDCDINLLKSKKVAMLGFGAQGSAHAQNLKDSGIEVIVGLRANSPSKQKALDLGFEVTSVAEAIKASDLIVFMMPDELHQEVFQKEVSPHLNSSHTHPCFLPWL